MTKTSAMNSILNFGRVEQHKLIRAGEFRKAYQIEAARNELLFVLLKSIKAVKERLAIQTSVDNPARVYDELTRKLLIDFQQKF